MKIACIGGGPGGLYFAISMRLRNPVCEVTVFERNRAGDTFGWGVVFSDQTVENLLKNDPVSAGAITAELARWDDISVHVHDGERRTETRTGGHGFIGIGRRRLLEILQDRARQLGVRLDFETEVAPDHPLLAEYDLVVAADGVNSRLRRANEAAFGADLENRRNRFVWLGTRQRFDAFTFIFEKTRHGWIWAHAYQFDRDTATFIVECSPETYDSFGFAHLTQQESCSLCEEIFAEQLGGHALMSNAQHLAGPAWISFPRLICSRWFDGSTVLLGDAAHTAHFSIGSGTKLALEDAIKLAEVLAPAPEDAVALETALSRYQEERQLEVVRLQNAARNSTEWFETIERYLPMSRLQFVYSLLTRSQRVGHESLRARDPQWLASLERDLAQHSGIATDETVPPMFLPFRLRYMELVNRVVMSPMAMYSAREGVPGDFHLVHYGARALGGAGLLVTEMTCVSPEGRITPGCTGLWTDEQALAWRRVTDFVHANSSAKVCLQLGHSGSKGSTKLAWEGIDQPLERDNWQVVSPSGVRWTEDSQTPEALDVSAMDRIRDEFVQATRRAVEAGFDMVELHCGHGYLLSGFISPTQNRRGDSYGGPLQNRLRFPLEVFTAMRAVWPEERPMSVRISAHDWVGEEGVTPDEGVRIASAFSAAGADLVDVSSGQVTKAERPVYGRMFQTPFSDRIRNELGIATMAVGNIYEVDHVNSIIAAGRADLCAMGRPHQMDANWTVRAAAALRIENPPVPPQYLSGFNQLRINIARAEQAVTVR